MKTVIRIFWIALLTVCIGIVLIKLNYNHAIETPNSDNPENITIQIEQGQPVESVINMLVQKGLLQKKWTHYFKLYLKLNDLSKNIQAGTYEIPGNLTIKEIVATIQQATGLDTWVTIPEGLRKDEIAEIIYNSLSKAGNKVFSREEFFSLSTDATFIQSLGFEYEIYDLEGYLFPDKYALSKENTTKEVIEKMVVNFQKKTENISYDDIIIASMVEREGYTSQDRPVIADIIKRRLTEGWLLQIDATLLYPTKDWKHVITKADKEDDNPYNTYKNPGLPPTPICNPGLQAIDATLNPKPNKYYFYIHDNNGNAHYAENITEHNRNIQKYLK